VAEGEKRGVGGFVENEGQDLTGIDLVGLALIAGGLIGTGIEWCVEPGQAGLDEQGRQRVDPPGSAGGRGDPAPVPIVDDRRQRRPLQDTPGGLADELGFGRNDLAPVLCVPETTSASCVALHVSGRERAGREPRGT